MVVNKGLTFTPDMIGYTDIMTKNTNKKDTMKKGTEYKHPPVADPKPVRKPIYSVDRVNTMALTMVRNIAYKQIAKMNKEIKENIQVDSEFTKMIDVNMKNAINKIIHDYKLIPFDGTDIPRETKK